MPCSRHVLMLPNVANFRVKNWVNLSCPTLYNFCAAFAGELLRQ